MRSFRIVSEITNIETIAAGTSIREIERLRRQSSYFLPVDLPRNVVRAMNKAPTRRTQPAA